MFLFGIAKFLLYFNYVTEKFYEADDVEWITIIFDFSTQYFLMLSTLINILNWIKVLHSIEIMIIEPDGLGWYYTKVISHICLIIFSILIFPVAVIFRA